MSGEGYPAGKGLEENARNLNLPKNRLFGLLPYVKFDSMDELRNFREWNKQIFKTQEKYQLIDLYHIEIGAGGGAEEEFESIAKIIG